MTHHSRIMQIFVLAVFLFTAANGLAGPNKEDATTAADVKEQAGET